MRKRSPGLTERAHRVREWKLLKKLQLKAEARERGKQLSDKEAEAEAERVYEAFRLEARAPAVMKEFERSAPTLAAPRPSETIEDAEIAAVLRHPVLRWLESLFLTKTNRAGFSAKREMVVAVFLRMAFALCRPEISRVRQTFKRGHPLVSWAHDYPEAGPSKSQFYESLKRLLEAKPPEAALHANIELVQRLAEQRGGDGKLLHPDASKVGIVDGMLIEADVPQRTPEDEEHRALMNGPRRARVRDVAYTQNGSLRRFANGYKLMALTDVSLNVALVWKIVPASCDEREVAIELVRTLFELWPDCPMEFLLGDALYDGSKALAHELLFNWGIVPLFAQGSAYSQQLPYVKTDGVPHCKCGEMKFKDEGGEYYSARRRKKLGIARSVPAPSVKARFRWVCENSLCPPAYTRPFDDPRLYGPLPRAGESKRAAKRSALMLRRNQIESIFATLKHLGLGGTKQERPKWADDAGMDWLISAGLLFITARRVVHQDGLYAEALAEAERLGLLEQPTMSNPAPGPSELELRRVRRERKRALGEAEPPRTWREEEAGPGRAAEFDLLSVAA